MVCLLPIDGSLVREDPDGINELTRLVAVCRGRHFYLFLHV